MLLGYFDVTIISRYIRVLERESAGGANSFLAERFKRIRVIRVILLIKIIRALLPSTVSLLSLIFE